MKKAEQKFDFFLSHSSKDETWASQLASSLREQGVKVWLDKEQLRPGEDFLKAVEKGISESKVVVTIVDSRTPVRKPFFEAGMAIGLGKDVSFVVPKQTKRPELQVFDASKDNVLFKSTPAATARQLIAKRKLNEF